MPPCCGGWGGGPPLLTTRPQRSGSLFRRIPRCSADWKRVGPESIEGNSGSDCLNVDPAAQPSHTSILNKNHRFAPYWFPSCCAKKKRERRLCRPPTCTCWQLHRGDPGQSGIRCCCSGACQQLLHEDCTDATDPDPGPNASRTTCVQELTEVREEIPVTVDRHTVDRHTVTVDTVSVDSNTVSAAVTCY